MKKDNVQPTTVKCEIVTIASIVNDFWGHENVKRVEQIATSLFYIALC